MTNIINLRKNKVYIICLALINCHFPAAEDLERFNPGGVCSLRSTSHHATWPFTQETAGVYFA